MEKKNSVASFILFLLSMIIFCTVGIIRRFIPLPSGILAFLRGVIGVVFIAIFAAATGKLRHDPKFRTIDKKLLWLLALSGALIGLNWAMLFESFNYTSVATGTLCYYMEPTIVILLSPLLLKEKLTLKKGLCALAAIIGIIFVSGAADNWFGGKSAAEGNVLGVIFGLIAACLYATVVIINKKTPGVNPYQKTIIQIGSAAVIMIPYILVTAAISAGGSSYGEALKLAVVGEGGIESITLTVILLVIVLGLVHTGAAYALFFGSIDGIKAQTVALFSYIDPVGALILSAIILGEEMTVFGIIGAVLILGAALISELKTKNS